MTIKQDDSGWAEFKATALLVLADGTVLEGHGLGAAGHAVGEVCFNTAMTGYEEILTDPSYAGQIITFTFPHIGNVGTNEDDIADVREREGDDLPGIRGIGEDLLVARHRGVEAHLAGRLADAADADAFEHRAVGEHQEGGGRKLGPAGIVLFVVHERPK